MRVCACVCVQVFVRVYACVCVHVFIYVCTCVSVCVCVCVRQYVCMHACMHVRVFMCMCICMYACMCVRMYVYACMHVCLYVCMHVCMYLSVYICICACSEHTGIHVCTDVSMNQAMVWLRLVGSLKLYVSFAKEPYKRDHTLQKRPIILRSLLIKATPYLLVCQGRQSCNPSSMTGNVVCCSVLQCVAVC